jgi:hypothetical protein
VKALRLLVCLIAVSVVARPGTAAAQQASEEGPDAIYLKSGQVVRGTVVDDDPDSRNVVLRTKDGQYISYPRSEILRVVHGAALARRGTGQAAITPHKSPPLAWLLSFAAPGAGQAYNGQWRKAGAFASLTGLAAVLYFGAEHDCEVYDFECGIRSVGLAIAVATWAGAQIDATLSAVAINRQRAIDLQIGFAPHRLGVSLARISF